MLSKKIMLPVALLLSGVTACSSKTDTPTPILPTVETPASSQASTPTLSPSDAVSTPTVVVAAESYSEIDVMFLQNQSTSQFVLDQIPSAYGLVFQALSTPLQENPETTLDKIHTVVHDSLGELYEGVLQSEEQIIPAYDESPNYGISLIHSLVPQSLGETNENVAETIVTGEVQSKSARLYLPLVGTSDYYILTIQEIVVDADHIYSYVELGTATISTFTDEMALELLAKNVQTINEDYGFSLTIPEVWVESEEAQEEEVELDGMTSASPATHSIETENGQGQLVQVSVKHFPNKVAYLDYSSFDTAIALGIGGSYEQLVTHENLPTILESGLNNDINLSDSLAAEDYSILADFAPDMIFINKDSAHLYDVLSEIAPVIMADTGHSTAFDQYLVNLERMSVMYSVQYMTAGFTADYSQRLDTLSATTQGKTAVVQLWKDGGFTVPSQGYELLFDTLGMTNVGQSSMNTEDLAGLTPDYRFVLDYDGTMPAVDYPVISLNLSAWTQHPGGVMGMDLMIADLEAGIS